MKFRASLKGFAAHFGQVATKGLNAVGEAVLWRAKSCKVARILDEACAMKPHYPCAHSHRTSLP